MQIPKKPDQLIEHKIIICSYKNYDLVKNKFKTKKVFPDMHCDDEFATYIRKYPRGIFNIRIDDWTIWKPCTYPLFRKWH